MTRACSAFLAALFLLVSGAGSPAHADDMCWRDTHTRGVGTIPTECGPNEDKDAGLCYPKCKPGYKGVGPVCWQVCKAGFTDTGAHCLKPKAYGRGAGYPLKFGEFNLDGARKRCQKAHGRCEKNGLLYYPVCKKGFHNVGCCICSPDCTGMGRDIGVSCEKKSYGRGVGRIPKCRSDQDKDAGLCYSRCKSGYRGVGPVCWGTCPPDMPVNCGAGCAKTTADCVLAVTDQVVSVLDVAANVAVTVGTLGTGTGAKVAASKAAATARKGVKMGAKAASKAAAKAAIKKAAKGMKGVSKAKIKASLKSMRDQARRKGMKEGREMSDKDIERITEVLEAASTGAEVVGIAQDGKVDILEVLELADPTGIVAVVNAYNKPKCAGPRASNPPPRGGGSSASAACQASARRRGFADVASGLCRGATGNAPVDCYATIRAGQVNWGGGTQWVPTNAVNLCRGSRNGAATIACFRAKIRSGQKWPAALAACDAK